MVEAENHELHWYALKVFYNKVFAVEEELTADGTECYVPVEETVVERGGQRRKVRRPVINSLMFFRAAEERAVAVQRQLTDRSPTAPSSTPAIAMTADASLMPSPTGR